MTLTTEIMILWMSYLLPRTTCPLDTPLLDPILDEGLKSHSRSWCSVPVATMIPAAAPSVRKEMMTLMVTICVIH